MKWIDRYTKLIFIILLLVYIYLSDSYASYVGVCHMTDYQMTNKAPPTQSKQGN